MGKRFGSLLALALLALATQCAASEITTVKEMEKPKEKEECFLFIGIQSNGAPKGRAPRDSLRDTWLPMDNMLTVPGHSDPVKVIHKFIIKVPDDDPEQAKRLMEENDQHGDLIFHNDVMKDSPKYIIFNTLTVVQYADKFVEARFVLKSDDDAYIDLARVVADLKEQCNNWDCKNERLFWGELRVGSPVHKAGRWGNPHYINATGIEFYMPHMQGAAYILSYDLIKALAYLDRNIGFLEMTSEDTTVGWWLSAWDVRRIDRTALTAVNGSMFCCVKPPPDEERRYERSTLIFDWDHKPMVYHKVKPEDMQSFHKFCAEPNNDLVFCFGGVCYEDLSHDVLDAAWHTK